MWCNPLIPTGGVKSSKRDGARSIVFFTNICGYVVYTRCVTQIPTHAFRTEIVGGPHEEKLIEEIFTKRRYNRLARPVAKEQDALEVKFGVTLQQIVEVVREACLIATNAKR